MDSDQADRDRTDRIRRGVYAWTERAKIRHFCEMVAKKGIHVRLPDGTDIQPSPPQWPKIAAGLAVGVGIIFFMWLVGTGQEVNRGRLVPLACLTGLIFAASFAFIGGKVATKWHLKREDDANPVRFALAGRAAGGAAGFILGFILVIAAGHFIFESSSDPGNTRAPSAGPATGLH